METNWNEKLQKAASFGIVILGNILYALAVGVANQWDYMPAYNDLLPSTITMDFLTEVANATDVTIVTPNSMYLYDQTTGDKYVLGVDKGLLYYEEVEE